MKKIKFAVLACALGIAGAFFSINPASASTPVCDPVWRDWSFFQFDGAGQAIIHREGCTTVNVNYDGAGNYYFSAQAQDVDDVAVVWWWDDDDLGYTQIQFQTPGSSVWQNWIYDTNGADFVKAYGTSATYNDVINGPASAWHWRVKMTTHRRCNSFAFCGLQTNWQTTTNYGPSYVAP